MKKIGIFKRIQGSDIFPWFLLTALKIFQGVCRGNLADGVDGTPTVCAAKSLLLPLLVMKDEITINAVELYLFQNTK